MVIRVFSFMVLAKNIREIKTVLGKERYAKTRDLLFKTDIECLMWFNKINSPLGNQTPYEMMKSPENFDRYDRLLHYIEFGTPT